MLRSIQVANLLSCKLRSGFGIASLIILAVILHR